MSKRKQDYLLRLGALFVLFVHFVVKSILTALITQGVDIAAVVITFILFHLLEKHVIR